MLLLYYIVISTTVALFRKKSIASSLPIALMLHGIITMVFGMIFGDLRIGVVVGIVVPCIIAIVKVYIEKKSLKIQLINFIAEPDIYLIVLIYLLLYLINNGRLFVYSDEYSHWGPMIKEMCRLNNFYFVSTHEFAHKSYVPLMTVIEYIACLIDGGYKESTVYLSLQFFMISLFFPALDLIKDNQLEEKKTEKSNDFLTVFKSFIIGMFVILASIAMTYILADYTLGLTTTIYTDLAFGLTLGYFYSYIGKRLIDFKIDMINVFDMVVIIT
nr:hypothetical protein [Butyrivibrio sp.]